MILQIVGKDTLLARQIDEIYNLFTKENNAFKMLSHISMLIGGIGALIYIFYKIWKHLLSGEPILIFPLLRPFTIGLCIIFFPTIVDFINAILHKIIVVSEYMSIENYNTYLNKIGRNQMNSVDFWKNRMTIIPSPEWESVSWYRIDKYLANWWQEQLKVVIELILYLFLLFLNIYRFIGLCILYYIGPIAFSLSIFSGFQNSLNSWIMRYVNMYLWLPVANIIYSILSTISLVIQNHVDSNADFGPFRYWALIIFSIFCIFILAKVPQITSWVIQAPIEDSGGSLGNGALGASQGMGSGLINLGKEGFFLLKAKSSAGISKAGKLLKKIK